jgi:hypothetical protein
MLTDEEWERLISWHRLRCGKEEVVEALLSARDFEATMKKIETLAGATLEEIERTKQALLNMPENKQE